MRIYRIASTRFSSHALPYQYDDLEPIISKETFDEHYSHHYKGYLRKTNKLINGMYKDKNLKEIIKSTKQQDLYNNAAQVWNHEFYWNSLTTETVKPSKNLTDIIKKSCHSIPSLKNKIIEEGNKHFGSGWIWAIKKKDQIEIITTSNAEIPKNPLMTIDIWEHAYYLDYKYNKNQYLKNIIKLINWNFLEKNYELNQF